MTGGRKLIIAAALVAAIGAAVAYSVTSRTRGLVEVEAGAVLVNEITGNIWIWMALVLCGVLLVWPPYIAPLAGLLGVAPPDGTTNVQTDINFDGFGIRLGLEGERRVFARSGLSVYSKAAVSVLPEMPISVSRVSSSPPSPTVKSVTVASQSSDPSW